MSNKTNKPKKSSSQIIIDMRDKKGITFKYTNESQAEVYLTDVNNYLRTAAFRNNYQTYQKGNKQGKYIDLDFAYLQELSTIDMHFRFLVLKMCSDIEHSMSVQIIKDIERDNTTDGYGIVYQFLSSNPYEIKKIEGTISSPHTGELIRKYFTVVRKTDASGHQYNSITKYDDCPAWVLVEILSFGSLAHFYEFYYHNRRIQHVSPSVINIVRSLRNAAAHNNCILFNLKPNTATPQRDLSHFVKVTVPSISKSQIQTRLSSRPVLEFVALVYLYDYFVKGKVRNNRVVEVRDLFEKRMLEKRGFFLNNTLLVNTYHFAYSLIKAVLF